jgi:hypothetical protein
MRISIYRELASFNSTVAEAEGGPLASGPLASGPWSSDVLVSAFDQGVTSGGLATGGITKSFGRVMEKAKRRGGGYHAAREY